MKRYEHKFQITRQESNFDRACDAAHYYATLYYGIDEYHRPIKEFEFERSTDTIHIKFVGYEHSSGYANENRHIYEFESWIERYEEWYSKV